MNNRTQVGIIGAGPAGLMLAQRLATHGIDSVILEQRARDYVERRIRAGVLEQGTCEMLREVGCGERMEREGLIHGGIELCVHGQRLRVDLAALTGGKTVRVYGQTEVVKDLIAARLASGGEIEFEAEDVAIEDRNRKSPRLSYRQHGASKHIDCDFIAGCDGFHGVSRHSLDASAIRSFEKVYPFAWLGILVDAPPPSDELIYARSREGFALYSMRSPTRSRLYVQCEPDDDLANWPDERVWQELESRLQPEPAETFARADASLNRGPILEKSITPMRSFVAEPMRHGNLFLAGDAAHIVPPTGAKGLNLAMSDVFYLSEAIIEFYKRANAEGLDQYSNRALQRVWKAERFSWWLTSLMHQFPTAYAFENRLHEAELDYLLGSQAAMTALAENYVGMPY